MKETAALCGYCMKEPTIDHSHVVSRFMGMHIKRNSPFGNLLNTWSKRPEHDIHKGPYLCRKCDNEVFSAWENFFSNSVWKNPLGKRAEWTHEDSIKFLVSLAFRYALHFIKTSPILINKPYSEYIRDISLEALQNTSLVGNSVHLYPFVHRPILNSCKLMPGINHFLSLAIHGESLPKEGDLPNAILVVVPKVSFLLCDGKLSGCKDNTMKSPAELVVGGNFDPACDNTDLPDFISTVLNRQIGQGQAHQKQLGRWEKMRYGADKFINPGKICYVAQAQDRELLHWKRANCR